MFHFVDQILLMEHGRRVVAVKHVTAGDHFLHTRDGQAPSLRSCIVGEALGQAGAWVVMQANDFTLRPVAGIARGVEILGVAVPGDEIRLDTTIDSVDDSAVTYHAEATVNGRKIFEITEGLGPMLPLGDFNDPEELRGRFERIHRPAEVADPPSERGDTSREALAAAACFDFDEIESWEAGRSAVARRKISASWPFFADHFPRKPVLPMTLLLESLLQLGERLIGDGERRLLPCRIRRVKMNRFVAPGSTVRLHADLKDGSEGGARILFRCEVDDQRICVAEADYAPARIPA